jgi:hypothetical protein
MHMILDEIITPERWSFVFGIPLSAAEYNLRKSSAMANGFVSRFRSFTQYQNLVIDIYQASLEKIIQHYHFDIPVIRQARLADFREQFKDNNRIIVLFTHWQNEQIEFADGMHPYQVVAAAVPTGYHGLVDLCVCHPLGLPEAIKARSQDCFVRYTSTKSTVGYWLEFYTVFLQVLVDTPCTYADAISRTLDLMLNSGNARPQGEFAHDTATKDY